jgi:hypothetical protein
MWMLRWRVQEKPRGIRACSDPRVPRKPRVDIVGACMWLYLPVFRCSIPNKSTENGYVMLNRT